MRDVATIDITWDRAYDLNLAYVDKVGANSDSQADYQELSVPLLVLSQFSAFLPKTGLGLCDGIFRILSQDDLTPKPIGAALRKAQIVMREISSQTGQKAIIVSLRPQPALLGLLGIGMENAVEAMVEQYIRKWLATRPEAFRVRAILAMIATQYAEMAREKGLAELFAVFRGFHQSLSREYWPGARSWGNKELMNRIDALRVALASEPR